MKRSNATHERLFYTRLANINPYTPTVLLESTLRKRARGPVGTNQLQNQDGR